MGSILGSGRSPGEGIDNPLQYSCLGNPLGLWGFLLTYLGDIVGSVPGHHNKVNSAVK